MKPCAITLMVTTYNRPEALQPVLMSALRQTLLPTEIIVADDGSTDETRELIDRIRDNSPVPIVHVWHPDTGFRLSEIRNKAIAAATGDYIIQIDGDVLLERHFIANHIEMAEPNWFVCGSRVMLTAKDTQKALTGGMKFSYKITSKFHCIFNNLRIGWLRHYLAPRFARNQPERLRGCNLGFWKSDLVAVNGYSEDMVGWGGEDNEMAFRLMNRGVRKKILKMGGIQYHLYHDYASRESLKSHIDMIEEVKRSRTVWCDNGLDKHLTH